MPTDPPLPEPDDRALLAAIAGGGHLARAALGALYERHATALQGFLRRLLPCSDIDDVLHDTFLCAARRSAQFRGDSARAWLCRLAGDRAADLRRSQSRRNQRERRAARPERMEGAPQPAGSPELERALAALPKRWQVALELRFGAGLTHAQVAEVLGVSLRTAKDWGRRAQALLEEHLAEDPGPRTQRRTP